MDRGDRGGLIGLGLVLAAVVTVTFTESSWWHSHVLAQDTLPQWLMVGLSAAATGVSIWAVKLVKKTLHETQRSTAAAIRAAEAAEESVRTTFELGVIATQPFIGQPEVTASIFLNEIHGHQVPWMNVRVAVTNGGPTPAVQPSRFISIVLPTTSTEGTLIYGQYEQTVIRDLYSNERDFLILDSNFPLEQDWYKSVLNKKKLRLSGYVSYHSLTDTRPRMTKFEFALGPLDRHGQLQVRNVLHQRKRERTPTAPSKAFEATSNDE